MSQPAPTEISQAALVTLYGQASALVSQLAGLMQSAGLLAEDAPTSLAWSVEQTEQLVFRPTELLAEPEHGPWVQAQGGLDIVYRRLRALPLRDGQRELLCLLLAYPGRSVSFYANRLIIAHSTYFERRTNLIRAVHAHLSGGMV